MTVSRVNGTVSFPCRFMLVAAMNPCPCGYYGHPTRPCTCSESAVARYLGRGLRAAARPHRPAHRGAAGRASRPSRPARRRRKAPPSVKARVDAARAIQSWSASRNTGGRLQRADPAGAAAGGLPHRRPTADAAARKTPLKNSGFPRAPTTACSRSRARSPTSTTRRDIAARHAAEAVRYRTLDRKYWTR